jgi:hypothetical protein
MISSFSAAGYLIRRPPHPPSRYDEPETLPYSIRPFCPMSADGGQATLAKNIDRLASRILTYGYSIRLLNIKLPPRMPPAVIKRVNPDTPARRRDVLTPTRALLQSISPLHQER